MCLCDYACVFKGRIIAPLAPRQSLDHKVLPSRHKNKLFGLFFCCYKKKENTTGFCPGLWFILVIFIAGCPARFDWFSASTQVMLDNSNKPSKGKANSTIQISHQKKKPTRQKKRGNFFYPSRPLGLRIGISLSLSLSQ